MREALSYVRRGLPMGLLLHALRTVYATLLVWPMARALAAVPPPLDADRASQWLAVLARESATQARVIVLGIAVYALLEPALALLWLRAMVPLGPAQQGASAIARGYFSSVGAAALWLLSLGVALFALFGLGALVGTRPYATGLADFARAAALACAGGVWLLGSALHDLARAAIADGRENPLRALGRAARVLSLRLIGARLAAALSILLVVAIGETCGRVLHAGGALGAALAVQQAFALAALLPRALWLGAAVAAIRR